MLPSPDNFIECMLEIRQMEKSQYYILLTIHKSRHFNYLFQHGITEDDFTCQ